MRGHVRKRGQTWTYVLELDRGPDGKRRQRWKSGFRTRKAAQQALTEAQAAQDSGTYVEASRITLAAYLEDRWLPALEARNMRPATRLAYARNVRTYVLPHLGGVRLQAITPDRLERWYADLLDHGGAAGRPLSKRSVQYAGSITRKALQDAVRWRLIPHNPARLTELPSPERTEMRVWTAAELRRFLEHVQADRLEALWTFAAMTGARRGEVLGLRWSDLDLEAGRAAIQQSRVVVGGGVETASPKSERSRRVIDLDGQTVAALRAHRKAQAAERLAWGPAWTDCGLVFVQADGQPLHPEWVSKCFGRLQRETGLPPIRLHDLRHTCATLWLQAGEHPKVVQERLGHASIALTLDTYSHLIPTMQAQGAARVAALVFGNGG